MKAKYKIYKRDDQYIYVSFVSQRVTVTFKMVLGSTDADIMSVIRRIG